MAKLRKCPYCGDSVDIALSEVSKTYYKISHLCNGGRVYICVTDEDPDVVADVWNGKRVSNYKTNLGAVDVNNDMLIQEGPTVIGEELDD